MIAFFFNSRNSLIFLHAATIYSVALRVSGNSHNYCMKFAKFLFYDTQSMKLANHGSIEMKCICFVSIQDSAL